MENNNNSIYKNITTSGSSTTLIAKGSRADWSIAKMLISNNSTSTATVIVDLYDGSTVYYFCKNVRIPTGTSLVLEDNLKYDGSIYNLRIYNTGTSPDLTVIIK